VEVETDGKNEVKGDCGRANLVERYRGGGIVSILKNGDIKNGKKEKEGKKKSKKKEGHEKKDQANK